MKISTILDKVDENQLFVPAFQREYVWKRDDAKQLIDSLIKEYPTGTMLTWETADPPELKGPHKYDEKQGAVRILLDGQQRVTTLYMLIRGKIPPYYTAPEITNDTRGLYVNIETLELSYYMRKRMDNNPLWHNITDIFLRKVRAKDIVRELENRGEPVGRERDDQIDDNMRAVENILNREFPEQTIPIKAKIREAIDIFYKVNASGVALTDAELALAQISGYWPQARDTFKKKLAALAEDGFVFKLDFVVYALLACLHHVGSEMRKLHGTENNDAVRSAWQRLDEQVLDYVVNLLRTHAYVDHTDEINSIYALIPIISYFYDKKGKSLTDTEIRKMVKWFYYSQIRARYVSQLPQKLDFDLRIIAESAQPFDELLNVIKEERRLEITPEEFEGRSISHPLFGLMRWFLKSRGAICLTTGVGLRMNMGEKYQLEKDHIFPYSRLKEVGYGKGNRLKYALAQELTNRAILTQVANRSKSATTAADYLAEVKQRFPKALALQCIPENEDLWQRDRFEDFLKERRQLLAEALNKFIEGITVTLEVAAPAQIEEVISEGESDGLEFKSSLRWDYQQGCVNKKLEDVIMKSVAAFANADGGTLLIGVDDSGAVLGLENDYASLNADKDKFELHLRNLLNQQLGVAFVAKKLAITFPALEGKDICQIEINQASEPVIIKLKDNTGQTVEKFFVRSGNSSQEIPLSQIKSYLQERFK
ncbi:GmrSD restriction endonuclease domain-containing protein [Nitrospira sp. T9]|uniref:GmrSD restriction endonuclease domain-containing protein n=1 Tax=unclassified Nitrospira TaxID=2652172 RepID=UPI003F983820